MRLCNREGDTSIVRAVIERTGAKQEITESHDVKK